MLMLSLLTVLFLARAGRWALLLELPLVLRCWPGARWIFLLMSCSAGF
jgi:hypothetical protein